MNFVNGLVEKWTGRALASAQRELKKKNRENETKQEKEERKARKEARRAAKQAAREQAEAIKAQRRQTSEQPNENPGPTENPVFEPNQNKEPVTYETTSVENFLGDEFDGSAENNESDPQPEGETTSALDDLD